MIMSVRFCLSYDILTAILSPSEFVYFNENLHCCNGRRHEPPFHQGVLGRSETDCSQSIIFDPPDCRPESLPIVLALKFVLLEHSEMVLHVTTIPPRSVFLFFFVFSVGPICTR